MQSRGPDKTCLNTIISEFVRLLTFCNFLKLTTGCQNQHFTSLIGCKYPCQVLRKPIRIISTCQTMTTRKEMNPNVAHLFAKAVIQTSGSLLF